MAYVGFNKLVNKIVSSGKYSRASAEAIAASKGRKKYGKKRFQHAAATGHKMRGMKP